MLTDAFYNFRLYIYGKSAKSQVAVKTLEKICTTFLAKRSRYEIVDLSEEPERGRQDHIIATPILIRLEPLPERRIIGDLSETDKVLSALGLKPTRL